MRKIAIALLAAASGLAVPRVAHSQQDAIILGARSWARHCTRCHNARASSERTDRQWETIIAHMRARGNLTREETANIAEYLKATNPPETVVVSSSEVPRAWQDPAAPCRDPAGPDVPPSAGKSGGSNDPAKNPGGGEG